MEKKQLKVYRVTQSTQDKITALKEYFGYPSENVVMINAITHFHDSIFPPYIRKSGTSEPSKSIEEQEREKLERKAIREKTQKALEYTKGKAICELMEGEIIDTTGFPHCKYPRYTLQGTMVSDTYYTEPFSNLDEDAIKYQYRTYLNEFGEEVRNKIRKILGKPPITDEDIKKLF